MGHLLARAAPTAPARLGFPWLPRQVWPQRQASPIVSDAVFAQLAFWGTNRPTSPSLPAVAFCSDIARFVRPRSRGAASPLGLLVLPWWRFLVVSSSFWLGTSSQNIAKNGAREAVRTRRIAYAPRRNKRLLPSSRAGTENAVTFLVQLFFLNLLSSWLCQEEARREAEDAHRAFAAYEGDLPTLLRVYEAFLKVGGRARDALHALCKA